MLAGASRDSRPAAGDRRRLFHCAAALVGAALLAACAAEPEPPPSGVRQATRTALALTRQRAPEQARHLEWLVAEAERIAASERAAAPWRRSPGRAEAAWERVAYAAWTAAAELRRQERDAAAQWRLEQGPLAEDLRVARAKLRDGAGLGRREARAVSQGAYQLDLAARLAARGDHQEAMVAARKARQFLEVVHHGWDALHERFRDPRLLRQWRAWAGTTIAQSRRESDTAIIVDKLRRRLALYHRGVQVARFAAELGTNGLRPKHHAGDQATPEGIYRVVELKEGRNTRYYKALLIDYPNGEDVQRFHQARRRGTIPARAGIGGLIEIHGDGGEGKDWTDGCVALVNADMETVFRRVRVGTPVTIVGTL